MKKYLFIACMTALLIVSTGCSKIDSAAQEEQNINITAAVPPADNDTEKSADTPAADIQISAENSNAEAAPNDAQQQVIEQPSAQPAEPENPVQQPEAPVQQPNTPDVPQQPTEPQQPSEPAPTPAPVQPEAPAPAPPEPETSPEKTVSEVTYMEGILIVNKTYALPPDYNPGVNDEALKAFEAMQKDAAAEGLNIYISSGFRSYDYQKKLYNRYAARDGQQKADTYSARAGHSEHQTGLAFDLNSIDNSFANTKEGLWVAENCYKYGFIIRYPADKVDKTGYQYEPWHIRYLGVETATDVYNCGLCLEEYLGITSSYDDFEALLAQQN